MCLCEAYIGEDALNIGEGFSDSSVGKEFTCNAGDPCSIPGLGRSPGEGIGYGSDGKESPWNAGYPGSILGLGRSPGDGNGYPLQYSCLENSMDRGPWKAAVYEFAKSWTQLSNPHTPEALDSLSLRFFDYNYS